jgi:polysaccharide export outer membrane protein
MNPTFRIGLAASWLFGAALVVPAQTTLPKYVAPDAVSLPAQPLGPEDLISIQVYDAPEISRPVRVAADGTIRLPMLKKFIQVRGLLPLDVEAAVTQEIRAEQLLVDPFVSVAVLEYHSRPITVGGAVTTPVVFQAVGTVHLLDALARAGGLTPTAGGDIVVSKRNPDTGEVSAQHIAIRPLFEGTDPAANIRLTGGEEIRIPTIGTVVVSGNVKESGIFPVQETGSTTVMTAIAQAKGLGEFQPKMVYIFRPDEKGVKHEIPVDLKKIKQRKAPDVQLLPKDLLYIPDNNRAKTTQTAIQALINAGTTITTGVIVYRR